jgi:hypothetical protein
LKTANDFGSVWKFGHVVTERGMRFKRQNLTIDAKTAAARLSTVFKGRFESVGVCQAESGELGEPFLAAQFANGSSGRRAELDLLLTEGAAETEAKVRTRGSLGSAR